LPLPIWLAVIEHVPAAIARAAFETIVHIAVSFEVIVTVKLLLAE
jgi:hypothetical protein